MNCLYVTSLSIVDTTIKTDDDDDDRTFRDIMENSKPFGGKVVFGGDF